MDTSPRVLVIEDNTALREAVAAGLRQDGCHVHAEPDGSNVVSAVERFRPDLAVLDIRMPGPSGLSVARVLRSWNGELPIMFLTAADTIEDRLAGFEAGADDYVVKPFALSEVRARVRALLRRSGALSSETWSVTDLVVDESAHTAVRAGEQLELTRTEFDLLVALGRRAGRVLSKTQLMASVWGFEDSDPNLVEVHVSALRRKLEAHGPRLLQTVRGVGYVLRP
ncbi:MAG: two-component system OmpR family response regulator [Glaciecola sp.]